MISLLLHFLVAFLVLLVNSETLTFRPLDKGVFRAAVYEHAVHIPWSSRWVRVSRAMAVQNMMLNIRVYEQQAAIASHKGADIIVFPEDGLYGMFLKRDTIKPYLEDIPDPLILKTWNPCLDTPASETRVDIQRHLSCIARQYNIYVVANMGDRSFCDKTDPKCPDDGQYQYNTDVAFRSDGRLVARYHKRNLFEEGQFDRPPLEITIFNTHFGRFGMFTCFDILFFEPTIDIIKNKKVRNLLFPTAWMDRLPYLPAIGFHSALAKGMRINLLSANIHLPMFKLYGSGIYTPSGKVDYYYNDSFSSKGKLIISEINSLEHNVYSNSTSGQNGSGPVIYQEGGRSKRTFRKGNKLKLKKELQNQIQLEPSSLPRENYTFVPLVKTSGSARVCNGDVCCSTKYNKNSSSPLGELFVLAAFNGYDDGRFTQICAVLKCPENDMTQCGKKVMQSDTKFSSLIIRANYSTPYIFPEVIVDTGEFIGILPDEWSYSRSSLCSDAGFTFPLITASLFGRLYSRDNVTFS